MPNNRYFSPESFAGNQEVTLIDQEFHHLKNVCRAKLGDEIELINGKGELAVATVCHFSKMSATANIISIETQEPLPFTITLALAFLRPSHLEYAIEKATEVGVTSFWLFPGDKSEKRDITDTYLKRLQLIIQGATKQCGRLFLPELVIKKELRSCISQEHQLLFGDLCKEATSLVNIEKLSSNVCLVVGPESGFSENERKLLYSMKGTPISLHPYTFRAETAAVAGTLLLFNKLILDGKIK
ncbi:MAG: 16S rRNA (uracil(1498)-N(3))-methyltransferase [Verrucomicrobia bacterium]|nr:16S rRNA (uracil(1498)-N(3))-methyltransferase [Verrucomicrobiota bacterium]